MGNSQNSLSSNYISSKEFALKFQRSALQVVIVIGQKDSPDDREPIGSSGD